VKSRSAIKKRQKGGLKNVSSNTNRSGNQSRQSASSDGGRSSNKSKFLKSAGSKLGDMDWSEDDQSEQEGSLVSDSVDRSQRNSPRKLYISFFFG